MSDDNKSDIDDRAFNLSKASKGWRGFVQDGKDIEFSQEAVFTLYQKAPYICNQVDNFINKRVNFIKN